MVEFPGSARKSLRLRLYKVYIRGADSIVASADSRPGARRFGIESLPAPKRRMVLQGPDSFISSSPPMIRTAASIRIALTGSPRNAMPRTNAPTAPIPIRPCRRCRAEASASPARAPRRSAALRRASPTSARARKSRPTPSSRVPGRFRMVRRSPGSATPRQPPLRSPGEPGTFKHSGQVISTSATAARQRPRAFSDGWNHPAWSNSVIEHNSCANWRGNCARRTDRRPARAAASRGAVKMYTSAAGLLRKAMPANHAWPTCICRRSPGCASAPRPSRDRNPSYR